MKVTEKIEFVCRKNTAELKGFVYESELDNDDPFYYYTNNGEIVDRVGMCCFTGEPEDITLLQMAWVDDFLFRQILADFANESVEINRGDYKLIIN